MRLEFDAASHRYTLGGRELPSVTTVLAPLEDFSMVPRDVLEAARQFGQHVHEACDLFDRGKLDWRRLAPPQVPYVEGWRQFLKESKAIVIASELRVHHAALGYAGSPDKVLLWNGRVCIPDLKATAVVPLTVGAQTAAYAKAYQSEHGGKEPTRCCIHLGADGYRVHHRRDPADWPLFVSCLNVYKFKEKHRGTTNA